MRHIIFTFLILNLVFSCLTFKLYANKSLLKIEQPTEDSKTNDYENVELEEPKEEAKVLKKSWRKALEYVPFV